MKLSHFLQPTLLLLLLARAGMAQVADPDELAIYRILFSGIVGPVVLAKPDPAAKPKQPDAEEQAEYPDSLKKQLPGLQEATIAAFIHCRSFPALLNSKSDVGVKLIFVDKSTLDGFWRKTDVDDARRNLTLDDYRKHPEESPWARFEKRFSARDFVQVSRVGFNTTRTQALVSWYAGSDEEVLTIWLEKQNGKWIVKDSVLVAGG